MIGLDLLKVLISDINDVDVKYLDSKEVLKRLSAVVKQLNKDKKHLSKIKT